jgi:hypothetical protein
MNTDVSQPPQKRMVAEVWCIIRDIGKIDTVNMRVDIKCNLYASWFDPRLKLVEYIDWDESWHPTYCLANATAETDASWEEIRCDRLVEDKAQFMCWLSVNGPIINRMDLRAFPFDFDEIEIIMDASNVDNAPDIKELDFIPLARPNSVTSNVLTFGELYDPVPDMLEFTVFALETDRTLYKIKQIAFAQINYKIRVMRKPGMILSKHIFPLFLTGIIALPPYQMDPIKDYIDRVNYMVVMFLATSAFIFIVAEDTPSTPYMKTIDKLITLTVILSMLVGLESMFVKFKSDAGAWDCDIDNTTYDTCAQFDNFFGKILGLVYTLAFVIIFGLALFRFHVVAQGKASDKAKLHSSQTVRNESAPVASFKATQARSTPVAQGAQLNQDLNFPAIGNGNPGDGFQDRAFADPRGFQDRRSADRNFQDRGFADRGGFQDRGFADRGGFQDRSFADREGGSVL